jgi:hypothetical protein
MGNTTFNRNVEDTFYEELIGYCKILKLSSSVADRARDIAGEQGISLNIYCQLFGRANTIFCGEKSQSRTILTPYRARKK